VCESVKVKVRSLDIAPPHETLPHNRRPPRDDIHTPMFHIILALTAI